MKPSRSHMFAELLRSHRIAAGFTQEELAERAGISIRSISDMERGVPHIPRYDTLRRLVTALSLAPEDQRAFAVAARSPGISGPAAASLPPPETGRLHNVPTPLTPLIDRTQEVAQACALLAEDDVRLLTLTGPGGVGKTRVALAVVSQLAGTFGDGTYFIDLAPLSDASLVVVAIARVLAVQASGHESLGAHLVAHMREKRALLVLDNFEHMTAATPLLSSLLSACPTLKVLITSRTVVRIQGEHVLDVPPLPVPADEPDPPIVLLAEVPSVALFVARARQVRAEFALMAESAPAVAAICRRLDGLPLAIELAAARMSLLSPQVLLGRLEDCLHLLTCGPLDVPERQQTLRGTFVWSYGLLPDPAKVVFRRLAVFAGGCSLEAVEAVCHGPALSREHILDTIEVLVGHNLVRPDHTHEHVARVSMLAVIHEFAREQLELSGEEADVRAAHACYFRAFAEEAERGLRSEQQQQWVQRLDANYDNVRQALRWAHLHQELETGLRIIGGIGRFWLLRGYLDEGLRWIESILSLAHSTSIQAETEPPTELAFLHAKAFHVAGTLACEQAQFSHAREWYERSLSLRRSIDDQQGIANTLNNLGEVARHTGQYARAVSFYQDSLTIKRSLGDRRGVASSLNNLGVVYLAVGEFIRARQPLSESLEIARAIGQQLSASYALTNLALVSRAQGDLPQAIALQRESLAMSRAGGDIANTVHALINLGDMACDQHDFATALCTYREGFSLCTRSGEQAAVIALLESTGHLCWLLDRYEDAILLYGTAARLREDIHSPVAPGEAETHRRRLDEVRAVVGEQRFSTIWRADCERPPEHLLSQVLGQLEQNTGKKEDSRGRRAKPHYALRESPPTR